MSCLARCLIVASLTACCLHGTAAFAQGLNAEGTVDTIVGAPIDEEETRAVAEPDRVIAAIRNARDSIDIVRKTTALDRLDIVFVTDAAETEGGPPPAIREALEENGETIAALRSELEGNAMLFHAVNSRQVLMRDVLAVEFTNERHAIIYVAAPKPS